MFSKILVLSCVCALALTACKKKDTKKSSDDKGTAAASMDPTKDDAMKDDAMKGDAMKGDAMGSFDAAAAAEQVLAMQALLTKVMVAALPDCDKAAAAAIKVLDDPKWKKVAEMVKGNQAAVKTAQSKLLAADKTKGAFVRGRIKVMMKCKGNAKHAALGKRLAAMWK